MRNIPEFHVVDLAVMFCGATAVSIYNSSSPEQVQYLAGALRGQARRSSRTPASSSASSRCATSCPTSSTSRRSPNPTSSPGPTSSTREQLLGGDPIDLAAGAASLQPGHAGHDHLHLGHDRPAEGRDAQPLQRRVDRARPTCELLDVDPVGFRAVSYLPMAHIAERMTSHYLGAAGRLRGHRPAPSPARSPQYARDVKPEIMFGVPRVWEKIHAGVQAALGADPEKKQKFDEAVAAATPIAERRTLGTATERGRRDVGLPRRRRLRAACASWSVSTPSKFAITGAAPIPAELLEWYRAIGVPMSEIYGMSENTGPLTWEPFRVKAGTVGVAFPGCEVLLADDGEVVLPRRQRLPRATSTTPRRPPRRSTPTAGSTPATSARSTTRATCASSTARRS